MEDHDMTFDHEVEDDFAPLYTTAQGTTLAPGEFLGEHRNYRLEKKLGEGGMAQVWLATEIEGGKELRKVVCKLLPRPVQTDSKSLEQIEKVFALTQGLNHPNICPIYGMKSDPTYGWFFVMGYADGQSLEEWFQEQSNAQNGLPLPKVLKILKPLASALDFAHTQDVIHRDVKPQNVMFTGPRQTLWLLDFGIASKIHSTMTATMGSRASSGTPHFMAPEQCQGDPQDGRTDQYALATLAYLLLSGCTPFKGESFALWGQIVNQAPKAISTLSPAANSALLKALAKDRHARFATCGEFVRALGGNVVSVVSSAPPVPSVSPVRPKTMEELQREFYEKFKAEEAEKEAKAEEARKVAEAQRLARERLEAEKRAKEEEARKIAEAQRLEVEKLVKGDAKRKAGALLIRKVNGIEYRFRWCPAGTFMMGSSSGFLSFFGRPAREEGRYDDETQHKVTLTQGFWMLETEVTQEQWQAIMGNNPSCFKGDNLPVENVSWYDCQEFCKKFNAASGLKINLPTEAQWEYACRAGTTTAYNFGSSLNGDKANCNGNNPCGTTTKGKYLAKTTPVGSYPANAWGLYDMHGNVCEWCLDWYDKGYYAVSPTSDPLNSKKGTNRVSRGGSWYNIARRCRSAYRYYDAPDNRDDYLGFRPLLVLSCPGFGS